MTDGSPAGNRRRRRRLSPLTLRILAVNVVAPVILVGGLFHLDRTKNELIAAELESLHHRAEMVAAAISEGAVIDGIVALPELAPAAARQMVRRLAPPAQLRARLFDERGELVADSRALLTPNLPVQVEELAPPAAGWFPNTARRIYDFLMSTRLGAENLPQYQEHTRPRAADFPEVTTALGGDPSSALRTTRNHRLLLFTAVPVQHYKRVLGAVLVSSSADDITQRLFAVRLTVIEAFFFALIITVLLSFYLAGTIARPIRRLAIAADRVRRGRGRRHTIPDLSARRDEIGDLSVTLAAMTEALWRRMDAIEAFAADVSHELKNPLTSLRSAVETVSRINNADHQRKLLAIIADDVTRLDRLISDISDASRLDAELSRAEARPLAMRPMIEAMVEVYRDSGAAANVAFAIDADALDPLEVSGMESRLGQVLRNLLTNALSFSPPDGTITLVARRRDGLVVIDVEDQGPGIPDNKLDAIFERFYSERPSGEKFGTHSGLGLSISRQIAETHGGTLSAANRLADDGAVIGARFTLCLPAAPQLTGPPPGITFGR
ncbi:MAG TPA: HAMP domain-containing protein [Rhodospirillaceae bacterium]|nr:HAMP domain-containing protein [Rhodospirillaceae bacterium]